MEHALLGTSGSDTAVPDKVPSAVTPPVTPTVTEVHALHADFVWSSLHRLGIREPDLRDAFQEVFLVVHRRLHTFDHTSRITTWLFGICLRVASDHRRTLRRHPETPTDDLADRVVSEGVSPEDALAQRQARATLEAILDGLDLEKRAVFVMFELESISCAEIAAALEIPVGTVPSRLHAARKQFEQALSRRQAAEKGARR